MMEFFLSPTFWKTVLASTTPVMLATLAANMMTKSGIFNLAIEGTMLSARYRRDCQRLYAEPVDRLP